MAKTDHFCNRAEAYEAHDNVPLSPADRDSIGDIILRRYSRREMMRGTLGVTAAAALFGPAVLASRAFPRRGGPGIASTSKSSPPAWTRPTTSPTAIARKSCSDGAIRSFPIPPPSIL